MSRLILFFFLFCLLCIFGCLLLIRSDPLCVDVGEIRLAEDNDFDKHELQIFVKYRCVHVLSLSIAVNSIACALFRPFSYLFVLLSRKTAELEQLSSTRQSGGVRCTRADIRAVGLSVHFTFTRGGALRVLPFPPLVVSPSTFHSASPRTRRNAPSPPCYSCCAYKT